jgi:hypothetical protein
MSQRAERIGNFLGEYGLVRRHGEAQAVGEDHRRFAGRLETQMLGRRKSVLGGV